MQASHLHGLVDCHVDILAAVVLEEHPYAAAAAAIRHAAKVKAGAAAAGGVQQAVAGFLAAPLASQNAWDSADSGGLGTSKPFHPAP